MAAINLNWRYRVMSGRYAPFTGVPRSPPLPQHELPGCQPMAAIPSVGDLDEEPPEATAPRSLVW
jgi:hypothetical protein